MYLIEKVTKENMGKDSFFRNTAHFCRIPDSLIDQADACEIWGTSFKDAGNDFCEYRFFKDGVLIKMVKVEGY